MIVTCWGARGAVPVTGRDFLEYGGDTTCIEVTTSGGHTIIIDAGSGIRELGKQILERDQTRFSLMFTHAHWDHLLGLPFFKPIFRKGVSIDIYARPFTNQSVRDFVISPLAPPYFPISLQDAAAETDFIEVPDAPFSVDTARIVPMQLSHPDRGLGYRIEDGGSVFTFLTDNELNYAHEGARSFDEYCELARDADLLIHDAEFTDEEYPAVKMWGHSTWTRALELAMVSGAKRFGVFHHNQDRPDSGVDAIVTGASEKARAEGSDLECHGIAQGMTFEL